MKTMDEILQEIRNARVWLDETTENAALASNYRTDALNKLNNLQKEFDEIVTTIKKEAHYSTDWGRKPGSTGSIVYSECSSSWGNENVS